MRKPVGVFFSILISIFAWSSASSKEISIESLLPRKPSEGWQRIGAPQFYDPKSLFKRIDGQAELFFKYGFKKSVFVLYQNRSDPKKQIEVDLYDMGNVLQAFGIFSRFRGEDRPAGVGLESYYDETSVVFYKGRYFVMLYGTEVDPSLLKRVAMAIAARISDSSPPPKEIGYFPKEGLKPASLEYYPEGLLGYQFLKRGFLAEYLKKGRDQESQGVEDREGQLFLAIFQGSKDTDEALDAYKKILTTKGGLPSTVPLPFAPKTVKGEDPNYGRVIVVAKGLYLAGAVGFDEAERAERLLEEFVKKIP